jgi:hypothetical protein
MPDEKDDKTTDDKGDKGDKGTDDDKGTKADAEGGDKGTKADAGTGDGDLKDDQLSTKIDVEEILDEFGLDSPADLKEFMGTLNEMRGKIGDHDLDTLLENTKKLNQYQAEWQRQSEEKQKEKETPEETIARLEKEKNQALKQNKTQADKRKAAKSAEAALDDFTDTVNTVIDGAKDLPKAYRPMLRKFMGIDNPINEVDITDKAALRRLTKSGIKEMTAFAQQVIKDYRAGKTKIPNVDPIVPAGDTDAKGKEPKNLKEAKAIMMQSARAFAQKS